MIQRNDGWTKYSGFGAIVTDNVIRDKYSSSLEKVTHSMYIDATSYNGGKHKYNLKVDYIIGLGGGTNLDLAKLLAKYNKLPWISVPTKPTAAIVSNVASKISSHKRTTVQTPAPSAIYLDPALQDIPLQLLRAEYGDCLASLTAVADAYLAKDRKGEKINEDIMKQAYNVSLELLLLEDLLTWEGINNLYNGTIQSGRLVNEYGSTRPVSGVEHALSHAMDTIDCYEKKLHGIQVGFATYVGVLLHWKNNTIDIKPSKIRSCLKRKGLPVNINQLGIDSKKFREILGISRTIKDRVEYTILDEFTDDEIYCYLLKEGVIDE
ncbi:MAG: iron-containing alcohol dehydrogenase [Candidatus Woesearchaeota archaeon]